MERAIGSRLPLWQPYPFSFLNWIVDAPVSSLSAYASLASPRCRESYITSHMPAPIAPASTMLRTVAGPDPFAPSLVTTFRAFDEEGVIFSAANCSAGGSINASAARGWDGCPRFATEGTQGHETLPIRYWQSQPRVKLIGSSSAADGAAADGLSRCEVVEEGPHGADWTVRLPTCPLSPLARLFGRRCVVCVCRWLRCDRLEPLRCFSWPSAAMPIKMVRSSSHHSR